MAISLGVVRIIDDMCKAPVLRKASNTFKLLLQVLCSKQTLLTKFFKNLSYIQSRFFFLKNVSNKEQRQIK